MNAIALRAIVLSELDLIEEDLTPDEKLIVAIEIACRLLSVPLTPTPGQD